MAPLIDTHIHLWDIKQYKRRDWLQDKPTLVRSFLAEDIAIEYRQCGVEYGIVVEAAKDSHQYNLWWLEVAKKTPFLCGAVLGVDLAVETVLTWFDEYEGSAEYLGVRAFFQGPQKDWHRNSDFIRGLEALVRSGKVLEVLVEYETFPALAELADAYQGLTIILNHCGLPPFDDRYTEWERAVGRLGSHKNVFIKYSGFLMIAKGSRNSGKLGQMARRLFEVFGPRRLIWGSNWPVDLLWGSYEDDMKLAQDLEPSLLAEERHMVYAENAIRAYSLRPGMNG